MIILEESILNTIKSMLGIDSGYEPYTQDLLVHINSAIFTLAQVSPRHFNVLTVQSEDDTWGELLISESALPFAKQYVYYKVRLAFDPPDNSSLAQAYKEAAEELEWRISVSE